MMKRIKSSWAFALLLIGTVVADPGVRVNGNIVRGVQGRKVEELAYGTLDPVGRAQHERRGRASIASVGDLGNTGDGSAKVTLGQGLDVNSMLNGADQDRGSGEQEASGQGIDASAIIDGLGNGQKGGNNIANAIPNLPQPQNGASAGLDASSLLAGLAQQVQEKGGQVLGQGTSSNSAADLANQLAQGQDRGKQGSGINQLLNVNGDSNGQGNGGGGIEVVEIKETIIQQINGGSVKETLVQGVGGANATSIPGAAMPPSQHKTTLAAPPAEETTAAPPIAGEMPPPKAEMPPPEAMPPQEAKTTAPPTGKGKNASSSTTETLPSFVLVGGGAETTLANKSASAITISASKGGETKSEQASATPAISTTAPIESATLTQGSIQATSPPGASPSAITVIAGGGAGNESSAAATTAASPSTITEIAGGEKENATAAAGSSMGSSATGKAQASAVTVIAGNGSNNTATAAASTSSSASTLINSATLTQGGLAGESTATAAPASTVTVTAGSGAGNGPTSSGIAGNGTVGNAEAAAGGRCDCACMCPAGSFPMVPPQAQPFQLNTEGLGSMPAPPSTLQTRTSVSGSQVTISAGGSPTAGAPQPIAPTSAPSINSATLTVGGLAGATPTADAASTVIMSASSVEGAGSSTLTSTGEAVSSTSTPSAEAATSSTSTSTIEASISSTSTTSVQAQPQVAGTPSPTSADTASLLQNELGFDISTINLQSTITANLGKRAEPTDEAGARNV